MLITRRGGRSVVAVGAALASSLLGLLTACSAPVAAPTPSAPPGPPGPRTVVSLTFDNGSRGQYLIRPILAGHGMQATFYIASGFVDRPDGSTMTWDEIRGLAADGNDIGGNTVDHLALPTLSPSQQMQEVCDDRTRLVEHGFTPVSFAYPTGASDPSSEQVVRQCGYRSGRTAGGVSGAGPKYAEPIPPVDPYAIAALDLPATAPLTLAYLQAAVRGAAARGGGWVPIVFRLVCQASDPQYQQCMTNGGSIDLGVFTSFVEWLGDAAPPGTVVQPVSVATMKD